MSANNLGKWAEQYGEVVSRTAYGDTLSYEIAARWVRGCIPVEDWGCGPGYLQTRLDDPAAYVGIDGTKNIFVDKVVDLAEYRSNCEGLVLRHVLEHALDWEKILDNAVASFTRRLCVILFTPLADYTHVDHTEPEYQNVPVIFFKLQDIIDRLPTGAEHFDISSNTQFGAETIIRASKP